MIAKNLDEMIDTLAEAGIKTMNTEAGQQITEELMKLEFSLNPNMTPDEWEDAKSRFLVYVIMDVIKNNDSIRNEFATHLYTELRKA